LPNEDSPPSLLRFSDQKNTLIIIIILISGLVTANFLDSLVKGDDAVFVKELGSTWLGIMLFVTTVATTYGSAIYLVSRFLTPIYRENRIHSMYFNLLYRYLRIIQCLIAGILILIIFQMILNFRYNTELVIVAEVLSFSFASFVMALLSHRLLSWYRFSKNITVLLYGSSLALAAISTGTIAALNSSLILLDKPAEIGGNNNNFNSIKYNALAVTLNTLTYMPLRIGFILYWFATVLLLRNYSKSLGQIKFWALVSLPLLVYLFANSDTQQLQRQNILFRIILYQSANLGAVFFCIVFLTTAKAMRLNRHNTLAQYLTISAYGTVLVATTLPQPVVDTFYPPFAVVAWSFVGLACYMYSLGFYFSAITISQDTKLRQSIRQFAIKESKLLDNIGTAQMEQEIQRRVLKIAKEQEDILKEHTGVEQSAAIDEQDMKLYLEEVMKEVAGIRRDKKE
jgi:hypothetical protein